MTNQDISGYNRTHHDIQGHIIRFSNILGQIMTLQVKSGYIGHIKTQQDIPGQVYMYKVIPV